jgi:hypothetical protein
VYSWDCWGQGPCWCGCSTEVSCVIHPMEPLYTNSSAGRTWVISSCVYPVALMYHNKFKWYCFWDGFKNRMNSVKNTILVKLFQNTERALSQRTPLPQGHLY